MRASEDRQQEVKSEKKKMEMQDLNSRLEQIPGSELRLCAEVILFVFIF
jgi:hypothetical protein